MLLVQCESGEDDAERSDCKESDSARLKEWLTAEFEEAIKMIPKSGQRIRQVRRHKGQGHNGKQRCVSHRTQRKHREGGTDSQFPQFSWAAGCGPRENGQSN